MLTSRHRFGLWSNDRGSIGQRPRRGCFAAIIISVAIASLVAASHASAGDIETELQLPWDKTPPARPAYARADQIAEAGRQLFNDPHLSASGRMACATCHDPAHGFGPSNPLAVQWGGRRLERAGTRAVPGLTYAQFSPFFTEHFYESEDEGNASVDQGPTGGRTWDGRVNRARDQALLPLFAPNEMANNSPEDLVARVAASSYASDLARLYGEDLFANPARATAAITEALEYYQQRPTVFSPFTSKYDAFIRGRATLTAQEARGLAAFNDAERGNCVHCHKSQATANGDLPLFTDFGFVAIGAPRNKAIPANIDPAYHDLGLCGPDRQDLKDKPEYCGLFKAPSLRNVALRQSFYHNGVFPLTGGSRGILRDEGYQPRAMVSGRAGRQSQ